MLCQTCGGRLEEQVTDLPFKLSSSSIVIIKELPVLQCSSCREYVLADQVMARVEEMLDLINKATEVEIVRYAA